MEGQSHQPRAGPLRDRTGLPVTPEGIGVENPAFDVTPCEYVSAIITERGVARAPYAETLRAIVNSTGDLGAGGPARDGAPREAPA